MILSVSRRTDIPAFFSEWFMNRLRAEEVQVRNHFNLKQVSRIPLSPENIDCIVFWTKDPGPMLEHLDEIDSLGYKYYFLFTLNPYGSGVETNLRPQEDRIEIFRELSSRLGPERVIWRYDPVILTTEMNEVFHAREFNTLAAELEGFTDKCIFSFLEEYGKIMPRMRKLGMLRPDEEHKRRIAAGFSASAEAYSMKLAACAPRYDISGLGIERSRCVDAELITKLTGRAVSVKKDPSQRAACGCAVSRDVGSYNSCGNGCIYCYANTDMESAARRAASFDPQSPLLCDSLCGDETVTEVGGGRPGVMKDRKPDGQQELF